MARNHPKPRFDLVNRIGRLLVPALAIVMSLLTFPSGMVAMAACWFAVYTRAVLCERRATWILATWAAIVVVKRVDWPAGLWFLMCLVGVIVLASMTGWVRGRFSTMLCPLLVWAGWSAFAFSSYQATHLSRLPSALQDRPIVCIGDSLTSYTQRGGYPEVLAEMVSVPVINLGQPGITSASALKKLPDLRAARPGAVVIQLGGHDFLKDASLFKIASRAALKRNIETIIAAAHSLGAEVLLIEIPRGFIIDPYAGLERELARRHDLELIPDTTIRRFVLSSPVAPPGMWLGGPYLSDDGLHPNARGNAALATTVFAALKRIYGAQSQTIAYHAQAGVSFRELFRVDDEPRGYYGERADRARLYR